MLRYLRSAFSLPFQMHEYNWLLNWCFARSNSVYKYLYSDWVLYPLCTYIYIYKVQWVYNSELTAKKQIQTNQWEKLTKLRKLDKAVQCVKLQIQDHSNKVLVSKDFNRSTVLSMSSNVQALCSFQVNHIRHAGTIFQTFEDWIPNQFHHAERRETTVFGITHWIPNKEKTSLDKVWTNLQWSNKWSMVFSSHWHRQHQLTLGKFFLTRLSILRIPPIVHIYVNKIVCLCKGV